jgi:hypothetical protein
MDSSIFCDWVSMYQVHPEGSLPRVNEGAVWAVDAEGEIDWTVDKHLQAEGSFDTKVRLRCDGTKVELSGNIGRWNRPDNVFGFTFEQCVQRANQLLASHGLPPFSRGRPDFVTGSDRVCWTGAIVTSVHLTQNLCLWSDANARLFLRYLAAHQKGRMKVGVSPDGDSVMWGYGSKYANFIAYLKEPEMRKHLRRGKALPEVYDYVRGLGIVRLEAKYKTRFLTQKHLRYLAEVNMGQLIELFQHDRRSVMHQEVHVDSFNEIPMPFRRTAKDWRDGMDLRQTMSKPTFYRHRSALLKHGIDIAVAPKVAALPPKVVELNPTPLYAPDWYREKYA